MILGNYQNLNIGMQYFTENISFDMWLSAPVFNDDVQLYGLRSGLSLFPLEIEGFEAIPWSFFGI